MAANRRQFLKVAAGTAVAASLPLAGARAADAQTIRRSVPRGDTRRCAMAEAV